MKAQSNSVRTLLEADEEWSAWRRGAVEGNTPRKKRRQNQETKPVSPDELLQHHVRSMLAVDRCMSREKNAASKSVQKTEQEMNRQAKYRRQVASARVRLQAGSSRSSTGQSRTVHAPTFDKKKYEQQKQEASLKKIVKAPQNVQFSKQKQKIQ